MMATGRPLLLVCSRIADIENVCSITPLMPLRKLFWVFGSMTPLSMAYCFSRYARILGKISPKLKLGQLVESWQEKLGPGFVYQGEIFRTPSVRAFLRFE